jgi:hypothetical protein
MLDRRRFPLTPDSRIKHVDLEQLADFGHFHTYDHKKQIDILFGRMSLVLLRIRDMRNDTLSEPEKNLLTDIDQTIRAIEAEWEASLKQQQQ